MELLIFIGIQATGKSSFWRERFSDSHLRLNLDMLKTRHREELIFKACLEAKAKCVIDNTNLTRTDRARYIVPARAIGFRIHGFFFESRIDDALQRNALRHAKACLPALALKSAIKTLQLPEFDEGFDTLSFIRITPENTFDCSPWRMDSL
jgi:predicted kinase